MTADDIPVTICSFETAMPNGPAYADPETMPWSNVHGICTWSRRQGEKDGPCFATGRFKPEPDGPHIRRLKANLLTRTALAMDIETNKKTGEVPPAPEVAIDRVKASGLAGLLYTSHTHTAANIRYRMVFPLTGEIPPELPAPEVMAEQMNMLGVLDRSKVGAESLFYWPSCPYDTDEDQHVAVNIPGAAIDATWIATAARTLLDARQAEADRLAEEAQAEAAARRQAKLAAGFNPDDSLIEKLRSKFDLDSELTSHGYDKKGGKYRHRNSSSGSYGADIATFGGIERIYSHNGTDPLHRDNLPAGWTVTALDAVDVVILLDYGGDRTRALRELGLKFGFIEPTPPWTDAHSAVGRLIRMMVRHRYPTAEIKRAATHTGQQLGLSDSEILRVAQWAAKKKEAA